MVHGVKFWNSKDHYYVQTNNPTEEILRKRASGNWLVSCGPTAAVNCLAAMGHDVAIRCPGSYQPQSEEVLMDYFNDSRNYEALRKVRAETPPEKYHGNEVPQFYPVAVPAVFLWGADFNKIAACLQAGRGAKHTALSFDLVRRRYMYTAGGKPARLCRAGLKAVFVFALIFSSPVKYVRRVRVACSVQSSFFIGASDVFRGMRRLFAAFAVFVFPQLPVRAVCVCIVYCAIFLSRSLCCFPKFVDAGAYAPAMIQASPFGPASPPPKAVRADGKLREKAP